MLASAAVHAVAAVTVGGVLALGTRGGDRPAELVELDLTPAAELPTAMPMPAAAPPLLPSEPVRAHPAPRRRVSTRPAPPAFAEAPAPVAPVEQAPAVPRFAMSAGTVATRAALVRAAFVSPPRAGGGAGLGSAELEASDAFGEGEVNEPARLVAPSPLVYPAAARAAAIELDFPVEIVVDRTGRVVSARALRHAGYGLDEAALLAIRDYRFSPAKRAGRMVPVRMRWTVQFRLR